MQRPYDVIANPESTPKGIFISAYASAPLAADYNFVLTGKQAELQAAVTALSKLTDGKVNISVPKDSHSPFTNLEDVVTHKISGPHPSGNVGTLINKIDPCKQRRGCLDANSTRFSYYWRSSSYWKVQC
jgi:Na+-transporting NADH:ubiquinone oxidoreductase subunit A